MPFLWFNDQADEAVNFYLTVFKDSKIIQVTHYGEGTPMPAGTVMTVGFEINGEEFVALNGGPVFNFTPAISFVVKCISQEEVDWYWEKLTEGGEAMQCGWLKDKYGVSWQIVPVAFLDMIKGPDKDKVNKVMQAMLQMNKLDLRILEKAYESA